jgi:hypothetical protein
MEAVNNKEVQEAAQILAKYNLGICVPHMHDEETGSIIPLPPGIITCERNLKVSFEEMAKTTELSVPVAWKWNGTDIEICYSCCTSGPR